MAYRSIWGGISGFGSYGYGSSAGLSGLLNQYSSIRSGAYGKALKSYYGQNKTSGVSSTQRAGTARSTSFGTSLAEEARKLDTLRNDATALNTSAAALTGTGKDTVFAKTAQKGSDGKTTSQYDVDAIYKAVSTFTDDYNRALNASGDTSNRTVQSAVGSMKITTTAMSKKLSSIGISVDSAGRLSVNEEKFRASDMDTVRDVFAGSNSYARQTASNASRIYSGANSQYASNLSAASRNSSLYGAYGSYGGYGSSGNAYGLYSSYLLGSRFNGFF